MNLEKFDNVRVLVIGDALLDHYINGQVERISPEAPVPVLHWRSEYYIAGGCANVAANIAGLGGRVTLLGVAGADPEADVLASCMKLGPQGRIRLITDKSRPTATKIRLVSDRHQLLRLDRERIDHLDDEATGELLTAFDEEIEAVSIVVVSDYAKGTLTDKVLAHVIAASQARGIAVLVDPKRKDFSVYRGATLIAPNRKELTDATGLPCQTDEQGEIAARAAIATTEAAILLTRSEDGMSLFMSGSSPVHLPTEAHDVVDVTGAGDTVVATLALALGSKIPYVQAMRLANAAGGIVVTKHGTAVVTQAELAHKLETEETEEEPHGLVEGLEDAYRVRRRWAEAGLKVGFTNGCFDILHPGHLSLLRQARAECDRLIVAVNSDASVRRLKGPTRPIQDEAARATMLGGLEPVDLVVVFDEDTPLETIRVLLPDVLVKGADYTEDQVVGAAEVKAAGGRVFLADLVAGQSTTRLVKRSKEGEQLVAGQPDEHAKPLIRNAL